MVEAEGMRSIAKLSLSALSSSAMTGRSANYRRPRSLAWPPPLAIRPPETSETQLWAHAVQFGYLCGLANSHVGLRSAQCCAMEIVRWQPTADKQTTRCWGCSVALESSNHTPLYCQRRPSLSWSRSSAQQVNRCYAINICAWDVISLSLPAAATDAAHICFDTVYASPPHPHPLHRCGAGWPKWALCDDGGVWCCYDWRRQRSNTHRALAHTCLTR